MTFNDQTILNTISMSVEEHTTVVDSLKNDTRLNITKF